MATMRFGGSMRRPAGAVLLVGLVTALTWASAAPARHLVSGTPWGYEAALGAGTAALAWLAVLWFLGCVALTLLGRLPGAVGRCATRVGVLVTPVVIRRLIEATLGASLIVASTTQIAHASNGNDTGAPTATAPPPPDRPAAEPERPRPPARQSSHTVRVRPGNTLWSIAASHLPAQPSTAEIAAAWPRWYTANRAVIGADPDLIRPGQRLHPPQP